MIYAVMCIDKPGALETRMACVPAHRDFLMAYPQNKVKTLLSGPLVQEGGGDMKGSLFLLEADYIGEIQAWHDADPMKAASIWESVNIEAFDKRVDTMSGS
jgi:uncharacterized protein YciI